MNGAEKSRERPPTVEEAKAALRLCAAQTEEQAHAMMGPLASMAKKAGMVGAGIAVASVVFGKSRLMGGLLKTGIRLAPKLMRFL